MHIERNGVLVLRINNERERGNLGETAHSRAEKLRPTPGRPLQGIRGRRWIEHGVGETTLIFSERVE
jgi:hypothetical protein